MFAKLSSGTLKLFHKYEFSWKKIAEISIKSWSVLRMLKAALFIFNGNKQWLKKLNINCRNTTVIAGMLNLLVYKLLKQHKIYSTRKEQKYIQTIIYFEHLFPKLQEEEMQIKNWDGKRKMDTSECCQVSGCETRFLYLLFWASLLSFNKGSAGF